MAERARVGDLYFDHAVIAGSGLNELETAFDDLGLTPEYGGKHKHDLTHNSLLGFEDGSYIELISTVRTDSNPDKRADFIHDNVGPCGWALQTGDIESLADQMRDRGISVELTGRHERETSHGEQAVWRLAYLGDGEPGTSLPFVIEDLSPRVLRITPTQSAIGSGISGVDAVIVGVENLDKTIDHYQRAFNLSEPKWDQDERFGAKLVRFSGSAVILAKPMDDGWLDERVSQYGELPCGILLAADQQACERLNLVGTTTWFDRRIGWLSIESMRGRLGIVNE